MQRQKKENGVRFSEKTSPSTSKWVWEKASSSPSFPGGIPRSTTSASSCYTSVLYRALQKRELLTEECGEEFPNLRYLCVDAKDLPNFFGKGEVDRIYLNFSDPWPKERHARRRLTSREFLARYEEILADGGLVEFKTDNRSLFDFSLEEVKESGWELLVCTYDLHHDKELMEGNVMTEYERKFSNLRNPIHKLVIRKPNRNAE